MLPWISALVEESTEEMNEVPNTHSNILDGYYLKINVKKRKQW